VPVWLPPPAWRSARDEDEVRVGSGAFEELNVGELRARGVEARAAIPLPLHLRAEGFALLQSVEEEGGEELPYVAGEQALGRLAFENRFFPSRNLRVRASVDTRYVGARRTRAGEELPAYGLLDALLRVQLIGFTLGVSAENVLDLQYRTEEGFRLPGRIMHLQIFWEFWN
nr:TonB-dependent receptor [Gemmatimonadota bacterium]